jgi:phosphoribosylformimino-5-aminoimidazole carboxamide ribotide isomerase
MKIIPTIDLIAGKAVRMLRGERETAKVYSDEPWSLVKRFVEDGAERIHVVDIDGAFAGGQEHRAVIRRIVAKSSVPIQIGGGIRNRKGLELALKNGAHFAVLGTAAVKDPEFAAAACKDLPGRIVIAVDAKEGRVAVEGWAEESDISALELAQKAEGWGASAVLYTDVSRDGTHEGPNVEATKALNDAIGIPVIASGGIGELDHVRALKAAGIELAVIGRALYDKRFTLAEAIAVAR